MKEKALNRKLVYKKVINIGLPVAIENMIYALMNFVDIFRIFNIGGFRLLNRFIKVKIYFVKEKILSSKLKLLRKSKKYQWKRKEINERKSIE